MFGQQNDKHQDDNKIPDHSIDGAMHDDQAPQAHTGSFGHPGTPIDDNQTSAPEPNSPPPEVITPGSTAISSPNPAGNHHAPSAPDSGPATPHDLIGIKQQALSQLTPLVGHLDQSPEDKFRTTMMMIQASDDQTLVQAAYDAAQQIEDEKTRAQALLDIVNEINYFTQHHDAQ